MMFKTTQVFKTKLKSKSSGIINKLFEINS